MLSLSGPKSRDFVKVCQYTAAIWWVNCSNMVCKPIFAQTAGVAVGQIKKSIFQKLIGAANNLGLDPFPDPVGHFGALQTVSKCTRRH